MGQKNGIGSHWKRWQVCKKAYSILVCSKNKPGFSLFPQRNIKNEMGRKIQLPEGEKTLYKLDIIKDIGTHEPKILLQS